MPVMDSGSLHTDPQESRQAEFKEESKWQHIVVRKK